jgi:hypothetical protein
MKGWSGSEEPQVDLSRSFTLSLALTDVEAGGSDCEASELSPGLADSEGLLFGRWLGRWSW